MTLFVTQKRFTREYIRGGFAAVVLLCCGLAQAQEFEGAWKLTMRKLHNGSTLTPPAVQGVIMVQPGLWTRVVFSHTPEGKPTSFAAVSTYKMSPGEWTETLLFSARDDGSGKPPAYTETPQTKSTPVTREGGRVAFKLPFEPPSVVIEGDKRLRQRARSSTTGNGFAKHLGDLAGKNITPRRSLSRPTLNRDWVTAALAGMQDGGGARKRLTGLQNRQAH